ncbi:MAG TPA: alpha/beta hydrolase fold domain-containing protein [Lapillicoccus sp.]
MRGREGPHPSLASRLVRYAPSIRRAHEQYATGPATRAAMTALRAGPPTYAPPSRLGWRVNVVEGVSPDGWPVYEIGPRGGRTSGHLVFLHGGAYFRELRTWHWWFVERLVRETALTVLVPVYPLAPVGTADTVVPAVTELLGDVLRFPGRSVFLAGDSAGAGMALAVAQELAGSGARPLAGLVLISPWVDVSCDDPGVAARAHLDPWLQAPGLRAAGDAYRGALPVDHPWVSPIHGELDDLPPMLVVSGTHDILNADAHRLVDALDLAAGDVELVEGPGLIHDYPLHPTPEGRAARAHVAAWLLDRLATF